MTGLTKIQGEMLVGVLSNEQAFTLDLANKEYVGTKVAELRIDDSKFVPGAKLPESRLNILTSALTDSSNKIATTEYCKGNDLLLEDKLMALILDLSNQVSALSLRLDSYVPVVVPVVEPTPVELINKTLMEKINAGIVFNGIKWYTDTVFQLQLASFLTAYQTGVLQPTHEVTIRGMDGSLNRMNYNSLRNLAGAIMLYVQTCYEESWIAKAALN
jgi:hypothetical protein